VIKTVEGARDIRGGFHVKPAPFQYRAARSVAEATAQLGEHGDDAAVLAGGQSLVPLLNLRLARPAVVIDINRVAELGRCTVSPDQVTVGSIVRARQLEQDTDSARVLPVLRHALTLVAHPQIRTRTTIGGNIAHADPAAELPTVLVALGGTVTVTSIAGERQIAAADFFEGPFTTAAQPTELVTEVRFPVRAAMRWGFDEVARRHGDFAIVAACVGLGVADGVVRDARVVLAGCGPHPVRCEPAEETLEGLAAGDDLADVAEAVTQSIEPSGDIHASARYRRLVAGRLVRRIAAGLLREAA
jgi:carbon-monoxide dehydrogenase medium subunit